MNTCLSDFTLSVQEALMQLLSRREDAKKANDPDVTLYTSKTTSMSTGDSVALFLLLCGPYNCLMCGVQPLHK